MAGIPTISQREVLAVATEGQGCFSAYPVHLVPSATRESNADDGTDDRAEWRENGFPHVWKHSPAAPMTIDARAYC